MSSDPRNIVGYIGELTDKLFPAIGEFLIQRKKEGGPKARLIDINTYLKRQQEAGKISGLTFTGTGETYSYQSEYVINNLVVSGLLKRDGDQLYLSSYGEKRYKEITKSFSPTILS